jgi:hypothetical protein
VLQEKFLACISTHMRRCEIFPAPCIWANSEFLETSLADAALSPQIKKAANAAF